jgi:hypothetical protein
MERKANYHRWVSEQAHTAVSHHPNLHNWTDLSSHPFKTLSICEMTSSNLVLSILKTSFPFMTIRNRNDLWKIFVQMERFSNNFSKMFSNIMFRILACDMKCQSIFISLLREQHRVLDPWLSQFFVNLTLSDVICDVTSIRSVSLSTSKFQSMQYHFQWINGWDYCLTIWSNRKSMSMSIHSNVNDGCGETTDSVKDWNSHRNIWNYIWMIFRRSLLKSTLT